MGGHLRSILRTSAFAVVESWHGNMRWQSAAVHGPFGYVYVDINGVTAWSVLRWSGIILFPLQRTGIILVRKENCEKAGIHIPIRQGTEIAVWLMWHRWIQVEQHLHKGDTRVCPWMLWRQPRTPRCRIHWPLLLALHRSVSAHRGNCVYLCLDIVNLTQQVGKVCKIW
jgi:hypothetical protein